MKNERATFIIMADIQRRLLRLERASRERAQQESSYTKRQADRLKQHAADAYEVRRALKVWREKRRPVPLTRPARLADDAWALLLVIAGLIGLTILLWFVL